MTTPRFAKILIANRGEIACRVIRSAAALGYQTVAVYSDADADAPHVSLADEAVNVGPPEASRSYLDVEAILDAARRSGAHAVHPGYGFLSENAGFARACADAGIVFIGPPPEAIEAMGDKARAKARMIEAGVPCVPGYQGADQSVATLQAQADDIGYPVLVKAAAGGGGRGMRRVGSREELGPAVASAKNEARGAFGSDAVLLEKLVESARHVEVQVFGDEHGNVLHFGERDCSAQRRHQKVIEEAPSPAVNDELRAAMGDAAVKAAAAIGYRGAGTVEFLLDDDGNFYFLEMNTRLQVEHPVTELVTGLDLVELQLRVAAGEPLELEQVDVQLRGHAIEARLYAEDPAAGFMPQTGPILDWRPPHGAGVRCDHGIRAGAEVSAFYDPMVAKVIAYGRDRQEARRRLQRALRSTRLAGFRHNKRFLIGLLDDPAFIAGEVRTRHLDEQSAAPDRPPHLRAPALDTEVLALAGALWSTLHGYTAHDAFRNAHRSDFPLPLTCEGKQPLHLLRVACQRDGGYAVTVPWPEAPRTHVVYLRDGDDTEVVAEIDGIRRRALAVHHHDELLLEFGDAQYRFSEVEPRGADEVGPGSGELRAPSSGKILAVHVKVGDEVAPGRAIVSLEAMKIETTIAADVAGTVVELRAEAGTTVKNGAVLAVIEPATTQTATETGK